MDGEQYMGGIKRNSENLSYEYNDREYGFDPASYAADNNDAKKVKLDENANKPSRVIHIGSLPNEISEAEIIHLGNPFGRVTNILVLKGKNQAFLEMTDVNAAATMVNYFANTPAQLRGRQIFIQYSNHKELKTDPSHMNAIDMNNSGLFQDASVHGIGQTEAQTQGGPNTILRVIVDHMLHTVTLDVLYKLFSRIGKVVKIITFTKNNTFQALVQFIDAGTALAAKDALNGQNIYSGCCILRIDYSKLTNLSIRYNNDKSRDYTNPGLPSGDPAFGSNSGLSGGDSVYGQYGASQGILDSPFGSSYGKSQTHNAIMGDMPVRGFNSLSSGKSYSNSSSTPGCVLIVSNLNELFTPDALFNLFGVYGDVHRVKILYNKKENALIQMAESHQAKLAMSHLDKIKVYGQQIRVNLSKHQTVQMPREGEEDPNLTKDYSISELHRFKTPGSKNSQNIYPPSATLHLSNIPISFTEEDIREMFVSTGGTVKAFRFFPKDHKMAQIQMSSVEEAVVALIKMHSYPLGNKSHLKVSFSKGTI